LQDFEAQTERMIKLGMALFACVIAFAGGAIAVQAADRDTLEAPREQAMTREGCIAAGAVDRARCPVQAKGTGKDTDGRCEEAMNLQQRMCMLDVLERSHPGVGRPH